MSSNKKQSTKTHAADTDHEYMHAHSIEHSHTMSSNASHSNDQDTERASHLPHTHEHENTKAVLNRMSRAIGHMEAIKTMVADGRDCSEVLVQIAAVRSAINNIGKIILEDHINHCVVDAVETGNEQVLKDLQDAINKFVK
jgi:DNA-binding FrmR family transcriptional regulator